MYASLMVHLELVNDNAALLHLAADLAGRFDAHVTGVVAAQPLSSGGAPVAIPDEIMQQDLKQKRAAIGALEADFRAALAARAARVEWRAEIASTDPIDFVVRNGRAADLVITQVNLRRPLLDPVRLVHTADLTIRLGRPVLAVPAGTDTVRVRSVVVGWKDTREARRAVVDALPLLRYAERVTVASVTRERDADEARASARDVCAWLGTHGIGAQACVSIREDAGTTGLAAVARDVEADLVVAGAYGHSRLREWVLGGVTRELLAESNRCLLLSH